MKPTSTEAAANLLRAMLTDSDPRALPIAVRALLAIPPDHPLRQGDDAILDRARAIERGQATREQIEAWAAELEGA